MTIKRTLSILAVTALACLSLAACDNGSCKADGSLAAPASLIQKGGGGGGHAGGEGSAGGSHEGSGTVPVVPHVFPGGGSSSCQKRT